MTYAEVLLDSTAVLLCRVPAGWEGLRQLRAALQELRAAASRHSGEPVRGLHYNAQVLACNIDQKQSRHSVRLPACCMMLRQIAPCRSGAKAAWMALDQLMSRRLRRRQPRALQLSVAAAPAGGAGAAAAPQAPSAEASAVPVGFSSRRAVVFGISGFIRLCRGGVASSQAGQHLYSRRQQ